MKQIERYVLIMLCLLRIGNLSGQIVIRDSVKVENKPTISELIASHRVHSGNKGFGENIPRKLMSDSPITVYDLPITYSYEPSWWCLHCYKNCTPSGHCEEISETVTVTIAVINLLTDQFDIDGDFILIENMDDVLDCVENDDCIYSDLMTEINLYGAEIPVEYGGGFVFCTAWIEFGERYPVGNVDNTCYGEEESDFCPVTGDYPNYICWSKEANFLNSAAHVEQLNSYDYLISWDAGTSTVIKLKRPHFEVTFEQDTLNYADTTAVYVRCVDFENNEVDISNTTTLEFTLDSEYGHLLNYDTTGVTYQYAKQGGVSFVADGDVPDSLESVKVTVCQKDDPEICGEGEVVVKENKIRLVIIDPDTVDVDTLKITRAPHMPLDTCKAVLLNYAGGQVTYNWKYTVKDSLPCQVKQYYSATKWRWVDSMREDSIKFEYTSYANNADTTSQIMDFVLNNDTTFIGGKVKIMIEAVTPDSTYRDTLYNKVVIIGENPTPQQARDYARNQDENIALAMAVTMWWESRFDQFYDDEWVALFGGRNIEHNPLWGAPNGYGICQIDPPGNIAQLWNWHENVERGVRIYNSKLASANRYVGQVRANSTDYTRALYNRAYPNATDLSEEQLQIDTYQLYQGGHFYRWRPIDYLNPDGPGRWVDISDASLTGDDRYAVHQQVENANNGIGTYPTGWNADN